MIKEDIQMPISSMRKFNYIFNRKEKHIILDEALYFAKIYTTISIQKLIELSINKYLKIKIYKRTFMDIHKDVKDFKRLIIDEYEMFNI